MKTHHQTDVLTRTKPARRDVKSAGLGRVRRAAGSIIDALERRLLLSTTVQFNTAAETVNASAGTFSIPVTLSAPVQPMEYTFASVSGTPYGLAFDRYGQLYVSDPTNGVVDQVSTNGTLSAFASGFKDPQGLAFDAAGNLYVADNGNGVIDKVTPDGTVSLYTSQVAQPSAFAFDSSGNLYVVSSASLTGDVKKVTPTGSVSTFASGFPNPQGLAFDPARNLYVLAKDSLTTGAPYDVYKVTPAGVSSTFLSTGFQDPSGLAFDAAGNLYLGNTDDTSSNHPYQLEQVTPAGVVSPYDTGSGGAAGLASNSSGHLYVAQDKSGSVEEFVAASVSVPFTMGGSAAFSADYSSITTSPLVIPGGQSGGVITGKLYSDPGPNQTITFTLGTPTDPAALGSPSTNTLTIAEPTPTPTPAPTPPTVQFNTAAETVNASAGTFSIPVTLSAPAQATGSTFASVSTPDGVAVDRSGNVYVADYGHNLVDKVSPDGTVSLFASVAYPTGLAFDPAGNLYVGDYGDSVVHKVTPDGAVSIYTSQISQPVALAFDAAGNLFALAGGSTNLGYVQKVTPAGAVSNFGPQFEFRYNTESLAFDPAGNLYVAALDTTNSNDFDVYKLTPGGVSSTFLSGGPQGVGSLAFDTAGNLYLEKTAGTYPNYTYQVDQVTPAGVVNPYATGAGSPAGVAVDASGDLFVVQGGSGSVEKFVSGSVSVPFTLGGTAKAGTDYSGVTASPLLIPDGRSSGVITGTLLPDPARARPSPLRWARPQTPPPAVRRPIR